jgi:hypothetical protein
MLSLLPPTRHNLALLSNYQDRHELLPAVIQTWHTGSPVLCRCPQCGEPAVVVVDYMGGYGTHPFVDCLVVDHRTPLNWQDTNDLSLALALDYHAAPQSVPATAPIYI